MFINAKKYAENEFPDKHIHLIIGLVTDEDAEKYKRIPILKFHERKDLLLSCKYVSEVVEAPLYISNDFIENHHIDLVIHGNDNLYEEYYQKAIEKGIMRYISYTSGISTTDIITRVLQRYKKE